MTCREVGEPILPMKRITTVEGRGSGDFISKRETVPRHNKANQGLETKRMGVVKRFPVESHWVASHDWIGRRLWDVRHGRPSGAQFYEWNRRSPSAGNPHAG